MKVAFGIAAIVIAMVAIALALWSRRLAGQSRAALEKAYPPKT